VEWWNWRIVQGWVFGEGKKGFAKGLQPILSADSLHGGGRFLKLSSMDIGLTPQESIIVRLARRKGLCSENRGIWVLPWWLGGLLALGLMIHSFGLSLLLVPLLFAWHRQRTRQRIAEWALDLRQL